MERYVIVRTCYTLPTYSSTPLRKEDGSFFELFVYISKTILYGRRNEACFQTTRVHIEDGRQYTVQRGFESMCTIISATHDCNE
jgi:hypothetical protein